MDLQEGHFYRDMDGDVWQAVTPAVLVFVANRDGDPDVVPFDVMPAEGIERRHGPLVEVRPTGWEAIA